MVKVDLELDKAVKEIKDRKAKKVILQLPDGLKQKAKEIVDFLEKKTDAKVDIWLGSCYGACDIPSSKEIDKKYDLLIQLGHSRWK